VHRPNTAEASGLAAPVDDNDLGDWEVIERGDDDNDIAQTVS